MLSFAEAGAEIVAIDINVAAKAAIAFVRLMNCFVEFIRLPLNLQFLLDKVITTFKVLRVHIGCILGTDHD